MMTDNEFIEWLMALYFLIIGVWGLINPFVAKSLLSYTFLWIINTKNISDTEAKFISILNLLASAYFIFSLYAND